MTATEFLEEFINRCIEQGKEPSVVSVSTTFFKSMEAEASKGVFPSPGGYRSSSDPNTPISLLRFRVDSDQIEPCKVEELYEP